VNIYKEFLEKLEELDYQWHLDDVGKIRRATDDSCCPWLAVREGCSSFDLPALPEVWDAADRYENHDASIRTDLLRVCKLTEDIDA